MPPYRREILASSFVAAKLGAACGKMRRNGRTVEPRVRIGGEKIPSSGSSARLLYFSFASTGVSTYDPGHGCSAGHARPAHSQGARAGAAAWLGNHQPHSTDVAGRFPGRAGIPVSRAASLRESWLGDVLLAHHGAQSNSEVLRLDGGGKTCAG